MKSDLQAVHNALRVGELLTEARIFSQAVLESRLAISKTIGQPLGQTLIQGGSDAVPAPVHYPDSIAPQ